MRREVDLGDAEGYEKHIATDGAGVRWDAVAGKHGGAGVQAGSVVVENSDLEFTVTEPGPVLLGAFVGLRPGEPSLGTITLDGYDGPQGEVVALDMAVVFAGTCPGDLTGDGAVDGADLGLLLSAWGDLDDPVDLNRDGLVDGSDLGLLLAAWGACP